MIYFKISSGLIVLNIFFKDICKISLGKFLDSPKTKKKTKSQNNLHMYVINQSH